MIEEDGYLVIREAIPFDIVDFVADELSLIYKTGKDTLMSDDLMPSVFTRPNLACTEVLMLKLLDTIQARVEVELCPTYSYMRYYEKGQKMVPHTDREACEYSITANIWNEKEPWPIWFSHPKGYPAQVDLHPGDLIIYKGCEITHWREVNTVGKVIQTFLHYVDINGQYADWAYDKRNLGEIYGTKFR